MTGIRVERGDFIVTPHMLHRVIIHTFMTDVRKPFLIRWAYTIQPHFFVPPGSLSAAITSNRENISISGTILVVGPGRPIRTYQV